MELIQTLRGIADLQRQYSSENTPAMKRRGQLIRRELPEALREFWATFEAALGRFASDMSVEGSDGIGRKTQAPWVRIYSRELSPSATTGYYMVIHFSTDGSLCFVTVGCGGSRWDSEKGDLYFYSDTELGRKIDWARQMLKRSGKDVRYFSDQIAIGSKAALPKQFEKATILCKTHRVREAQTEDVVRSVTTALEMLKVLYERHSENSDSSTSESISAQVEGLANPNKAGNRQGYGLTAEERKAIELRGMRVTAEFLKAKGYRITDTSAKKPFDFLAKKGDEEIKVEVKATTSPEIDAILMTKGEVDLHQNEAGFTALALVSAIQFSERGEDPQCTGGELEFIFPWDITEWALSPKAFEVKRIT